MRTILSGPCLLELDNRECLKVDCAGRFGKEVVFNYTLHVFFFSLLEAKYVFIKNIFDATK